MLNLDSRVDLNKVVSAHLVDEKLDCSSVGVADLPADGCGVPEETGEGLARDVRSGSDLDNLLVSSLDRAVSLKEVDDVALVVSDDLDLNVLGLVKETCRRERKRIRKSAFNLEAASRAETEIAVRTLDEYGSISESALGLRRGSLERSLHLRLLSDDTHASTSSSERSLDDDGESVLLGERLGVLPSLDRSGRSRDDGHVVLDRCTIPVKARKSASARSEEER